MVAVEPRRGRCLARRLDDVLRGRARSRQVAAALFLCKSTGVVVRVFLFGVLGYLH